jgi:hypothetical protein
LSIAAAVLGYILVERFARKREARNDLKALLDSFTSTLERILTDATAFYAEAGATPRARALASVIKSKVAFLAEILDAMRSAGVNVQADVERTALRKSITGGLFDSLARPGLAANDSKFVEMADATEQLRRRVELSFYNSLVRDRVVRPGRKKPKRLLRDGEREVRPKP